MNNERQISGVLVVQKLTPVISTLFSGFQLDLTRLPNGHLYFSKSAKAADLLWSELHRHLRSLIRQMGLTPKLNSVGSIWEYLLALATHFDTHRDPELLNTLTNLNFDGQVHPSALFFFATRFNDGHGLRAMKFQDVAPVNYQDHLECYDYREYHGRNIWISDRLNTPGLVGHQIDAALDHGDLDKAAHRLFAQIEHQLNGVFKLSVRNSLRAKIAEHLLSELNEISNKNTTL